MIDDRKKKVYAKTNNGAITRLGNKYRKANAQLKDIKAERDASLTELRDIVLEYFNPEDENNTRVLQTPSISISVNKRTIRKSSSTDMEKVFENISEMYNIPRDDLDKIVETNTTVSEVEIKPTVKVSG